MPRDDIAEIQTQPDAEPQLVTGTLREELYRNVRNNSQRGWVIEDNGIRHAYLQPKGNDFLGIRHNVIEIIDPETLANRQRMERAVPGDKLTGITDPDHPGIATELIMVEKSSHGNAQYLHPTTGEKLELRFSSKAECQQIIPGANLTDDEASTVFPTWPEIKASDLRPGDRALVGDLNPSGAKSNRNPATILTTAGYGTPSFTYLQDGTTEPVAASRQASSVVPLISRRYGALTDVERREAAGATFLDNEAACQAQPGTRVWVQPGPHTSKADKFTPYAGTIAHVELKQSTKYSRYEPTPNREYALVTITKDTGEQVTHDYRPESSNRYDEDIIAYPLGIAIPLSIDPHSGQPTYPTTTMPSRAPAAPRPTPDFNHTPGAWANQNPRTHAYDFN